MPFFPKTGLRDSNFDQFGMKWDEKTVCFCQNDPKTGKIRSIFIKQADKDKTYL